MKFLFILITSSILLTSCDKSDCENLGANFSSYNSAISTIRSTDFSIEEKENTDSSWIDSIEYYSCDGETGFLIINTKRGQSYIHNGVPIAVWEEFKNASSFGSYYNSSIKGRYYFNLSN